MAPSCDRGQCSVGESGVASLRRGLRGNETLTHLGLRYVNLPRADNSDSSLEPPFSLARLLEEATGLTSLDLAFNIAQGSGHAVEDLQRALGSATRLRTLSLARCCVGGWRRARAVARGLAASTSITAIDLSHNGLGAAAPPPPPAGQQGSPRPFISMAVEALCRAVRANGALRVLRLAHNALGDDASAAVVLSALSSSSLASLDLRSNGVTPARLRDLFSALYAAGAQWLPAVPPPAAHLRRPLEAWLATAAAAAAAAATATGSGWLCEAAPPRHLPGPFHDLPRSRLRRRAARRRPPFQRDARGGGERGSGRRRRRRRGLCRLGRGGRPGWSTAQRRVVASRRSRAALSTAAHRRPIAQQWLPPASRRGHCRARRGRVDGRAHGHAHGHGRVLGLVTPAALGDRIAVASPHADGHRRAAAQRDARVAPAAPSVPAGRRGRRGRRLCLRRGAS
uniref:Uncharacterized protein n=1 Tax=Emiliania huxleyi TaxID=2903 RepID=A0A7S3SIC3_EMIHU